MIIQFRYPIYKDHTGNTIQTGAKIREPRKPYPIPRHKDYILPHPGKENIGCFLCQRFRKFRSEIKWKGPFRFFPTGIFGITSGGGPLISVGILPPKFALPLLTNGFFALIREPIGWHCLIGKYRSIFLGYSY